MKLINSSFEILEQEPGLQSIHKQIELAGRTCYKSLDKITKDSAKDFVGRMIASQHHAMLEHGTVYLLFSECCYHRPDGEFIDKYTKNPYSKVVCIGTDDDLVEQTQGKKDYLGDILGTGVYGNALYAITTNYRVLVENGWLDDLKYLYAPTKYHEKRVTVRFTTSNSIMREFTRHRTMSFAVESTRYCNYSKDKFNNELTFIKPYWFGSKFLSENGEYDANSFFRSSQQSVKESAFINSLLTAESSYLSLIDSGCSPQEAREVLPLATKCDMVMTGFTSDWNHFFDLRARGTTGAPHPDAKALAEPLMGEFYKRGYIK